MMLPELLDIIDANTRVNLEFNNGTLRLVAPRYFANNTDVVEAIRVNRDLLAHHVVGACTGHAIGICTECGEPSMVHVNPASNFPACRATAGCPGRHTPRDADIRSRRHHERPKQPKEAKRPKRKRLLGPWPVYPPPTGATR